MRAGDREDRPSGIPCSETRGFQQDFGSPLLCADVPQPYGVVETARDEVVVARVKCQRRDGLLVPLEVADKRIIVCSEVSDSICESTCKFAVRTLKIDRDAPFCLVLA